MGSVVSGGVASKGGLGALARAAAVELIQEGIRVNVICPFANSPGIIGAACGLASAILWLKLVRRSRGLQHALALRPDGTPLGLPDSASEEE